MMSWSKRSATIVTLSAVSLIASAVVLVWAINPRPRTIPIDAVVSERVGIGQQVYADYCASCHGANLEGQPNWRQRLPNGRVPAPPHDETGHTWHHSDETLFKMTKVGIETLAPEGYESDMPAFENVLSNDEISAVIAYIKRRWPPITQARQETINKR